MDKTNTSGGIQNSEIKIIFFEYTLYMMFMQISFN